MLDIFASTVIGWSTECHVLVATDSGACESRHELIVEKTFRQIPRRQSTNGGTAGDRNRMDGLLRRGERVGLYEDQRCVAACRRQ